MQLPMQSCCHDTQVKKFFWGAHLDSLSTGPCVGPAEYHHAHKRGGEGLGIK